MHPFLVQFPNGWFLPSYGAMIALGILCAYFLAAWRGARFGIRSDAFADITFLSVLSGFLGARALYIILNFGQFVRDPIPMLLSQSGFVFLGGFLAAVGAASWYVWRNKMDYWLTGDLVLPSVALGHAFGRIGCHLSGCCFGGLCNLPIGIRVPPIEAPDGDLWPNVFVDQLSRGLIGSDATSSLSVWPVQLMEASGLFLLTAGLVVLGLRPFRKGLIFGLYVAGYALLRFSLEFIRGDEERGLFNLLGVSLSTSQWLSLGLFVVGVGVAATAPLREVVTPKAPSEFPKDPGESTPDSRAEKRRQRNAPRP